MKKRSDAALFGYTVGPHSWKQFLFPPEFRLWRAHRTQDGFRVEPTTPPKTRYAFLGVGACELNAILIQNRVFLEGPFTDPTYQALRDQSLIIAVNCTQAASTCFCTSMHTGPKVQTGYDLALTEIIQPDRHFFLIEIGTSKGRDIVKQLPLHLANEDDLSVAEAAIQQAVQTMVLIPGISSRKEWMKDQYEQPHWEHIAQRCLSCGNCTMVCPTCFCTTVEDVTNLTGHTTERIRRWDSCFSMEFSYIHGGVLRQSVAARYRQWFMHKLVNWWDQFHTSGCVGCGRCITWCPVGIDLREEFQAFQRGGADPATPTKKESYVP